MEISDVTVAHLKDRPGQIVMVDFNNDGGRCLTFLVDDVEHPQVPGYPAVSLSYFNSVKDARLAIVDKYNELGYWPKNNCFRNAFCYRNKWDALRMRILEENKDET